MKNIIEILKEHGVEVPADKEQELLKGVAENYKTISEHQKAFTKIETDRDNWKLKAETAEETLKKFEGVDLETMQTELSSWKTKAENAEKEYNQKIYERDFEDVLGEEIGKYKFSSEFAKKAVIAEIKSAGLKLKDRKILGLNDLIETIKKTDASAFVDENQTQLQNNRMSFTDRRGTQPTGKVYNSREDVMNIKDASERQTAIAENMHLFT